MNLIVAVLEQAMWAKDTKSNFPQNTVSQVPKDEDKQSGEGRIYSREIRQGVRIPPLRD